MQDQAVCNDMLNDMSRMARLTVALRTSVLMSKPTERLYSRTLKKTSTRYRRSCTRNIRCRHNAHSCARCINPGSFAESWQA